MLILAELKLFLASLKTTGTVIAAVVLAVVAFLVLLAVHSAASDLSWPVDLGVAILAGVGYFVHAMFTAPATPAK